MKKHRIEFEINYAKAIEAVLYVLSKQESSNLYNVLKVIFEADKIHLNEHCRPVTGDVYFKMEHGTVPSAIYDMLKGDPAGLAELSMPEYPFKLSGFMLTASRTPKCEYLSQSDLEALDRGITKYLRRTFSEVKAINHAERCWLESEMNSRIDFALMIENKKVLKTLTETPLRIVV